MKLQVTIQMPVMPNFLIVEDMLVGTSIRPCTQPKPKIPVRDLTDDQVNQFIKEWGEAFRDHVAKRRRMKQ